MEGSRNSLPNQLVSTFNLTPGDSSTACEAAIVCATWFERHSMLAGKIDTTPSIHSTWSPRATFHKPGPGTTPVTLIACSVTIDEAGTGCEAVEFVTATGAPVAGVCAMAVPARASEAHNASHLPRSRLARGEGAILPAIDGKLARYCIGCMRVLVGDARRRFNDDPCHITCHRPRTMPHGSGRSRMLPERHDLMPF